MDITGISSQLVIGISSGILTFLMAAGVSLVMSGMNIINFGQGAFFMFAAYLCLTIAGVFNFWWALLLAPLVVAAIAGFVELFLRPLYGKSMLYQLLLTMGIAFVLIDSMTTIWGNAIRIVNVPHVLSTSVAVLGINFPVYYIFIIVVGGIVALGLFLMFEKTKLGMLFRAIISDRPMVNNLGVNVSLLFSVMFMFGVWLSGVAGVITAPIMGINAQQSMNVLFSVMTVLIIGGLKSMRGAFFAALIVGIVNALGSLWFSAYYSLIPSALMIIVLLVKPAGLFARAQD